MQREELQIQIVRFNVAWKATVKDDARFHDVELETIKYDSSEFRAPTDNEKERLRLPERFRDRKESELSDVASQDTHTPGGSPLLTQSSER